MDKVLDGDLARFSVHASQARIGDAQDPHETFRNSFVHVPEIPKTSTGKIQKFRLRELAKQLT